MLEQPVPKARPVGTHTADPRSCINIRGSYKDARGPFHWADIRNTEYKLRVLIQM